MSDFFDPEDMLQFGGKNISKAQIAQLKRGPTDKSGGVVKTQNSSGNWGSSLDASDPFGVMKYAQATGNDALARAMAMASMASIGALGGSTGARKQNLRRINEGVLGAFTGVSDKLSGRSPSKGGGGHRARGGVGLGSGAMKPQAFSRNPHQEEKDFATQLRRKAAEARALSDVEADSVNRQLSEKMRLVQQLLGGNRRYMTTERRTSQTPVNSMGHMKPMDLVETTQRDYTPEIQQQLMQLLFR